jgi:DNA-binding transcriptional ArsR family regulator
MKVRQEWPCGHYRTVVVDRLCPCCAMPQQPARPDIVDSLRALGEVDVHALVADTGRTRRAISRQLTAMRAEGIVARIDRRTDGTPGRPPSLWRLL